MHGITFGFHIGFKGPVIPSFCPNSPTIMENFSATQDLIDKELASARVAGPFDMPPFCPFKVSPLTIRPKSKPGQFRLIHNLSAPYDGSSVNDNISDHHKSVQYESVSNIVALLLELGKGAFLAKADIQSAFRLIPVHPSCYPLLGFYFNNKYFFDRCLTMGGGSSCRIFEIIATSVNWALENMYGIHNAFHYLDDFCFVEDSYEKCMYDITVFKEVCKKLGIPLAMEKLEGPSTHLTFLGIHLNTVTMEASIPAEKIQKYIDNIRQLLSVNEATQAEVKTVIGQLNWCTAIVVSGRGFIRRLHDITLGPHCPGKFVPITDEIKKDLRIWLTFLQHFNGRVFIDYMPIESSETLNFFTDASFMGAGGVCGSQWYQIKYPPDWASRHITYLELFPVVVGAHIFKHIFSGKKIVFYTDNYAVMVILNKCTSPNKKFMPLVRQLVLLSMQYQFRITSKHVRGIFNLVPDKISRFQMSDEFLRQHNLNPFPTQIPMAWTPTNWQKLENTC